MFEVIVEALKAVWSLLKNIYVKICSFFKNVISFFRDSTRLRKLQADQNRIAVTIKEKLESGNYNVVNCLFDTEKNQVVDAETDAEVINAAELDSDMLEHFGDKDMLVIK